MMVLVTYDVNTEDKAGKSRLRKVAKCCENYGQRVQNSVFECVVDPVQFTELKLKLNEIINKEVDSIRYYFLGKNWKRRVKHVGAKPVFDPEGFIFI